MRWANPPPRMESGACASKNSASPCCLPDAIAAAWTGSFLPHIDKEPQVTSEQKHKLADLFAKEHVAVLITHGDPWPTGTMQA